MSRGAYKGAGNVLIRMHMHGRVRTDFAEHTQLSSVVEEKGMEWEVEIATKADLKK